MILEVVEVSVNADNIPLLYDIELVPLILHCDHIRKER